MKIKVNNKFKPKNNELLNVDFIKSNDPIFNGKYNIKMNVELVDEKELDKTILVSEKFKREIIPKKIVRVKNKFKRGET